MKLRKYSPKKFTKCHIYVCISNLQPLSANIWSPIVSWAQVLKIFHLKTLSFRKILGFSQGSGSRFGETHCKMWSCSNIATDGWSEVLASFIEQGDIFHWTRWYAWKIGKLLNSVSFHHLVSCNKRINLDYIMLLLIKSNYIGYIH